MNVPAAVETAVAALVKVPPAEWVAVVLAFGYLLLAVRQNAWCWVCAVASSAIFLVLFAQAGLVMQSALQVFYIGMGVYGWRAWRGGRDGGGMTLPVSRWRARRHLLAIGAIIAVSAVNGWLVAPDRASVVPYVDAFVAWGSVLATAMVTRKLLENWLYWIVLDSVAAALYWSQGFHATAVLFVLYVVIAMRGYVEWRADYARAGLAATERVHA